MTALDLPSLSPENARAANRFFASPARCTVTLGAARFLFRLEPGAVTADAWGARLHGSWGESPCTLFIREEAVGPMLAAAGGHDVDPHLLRDTPEPLQLALLQTALEPGLDRLEEAAGLTVGLDACDLSRSEALPTEGMLAFSLTPVDGGPVLGGAILFDDPRGEARSSLAALLREVGEVEPAPPRAELRLRLDVEAGWVRLPVDQVATLGRGDVILLDSVASAGDTAVQVRVGRTLCWSATLETTTVTLGDPVMPDDAEMTDEATPAEGSSSDAPGAAGAAEVRLDLIIDSRMIPLHEVEGLRPGVTVETTRGLDAPVTLAINGTAVARGELLDVGGRIGVRIVDPARGES